MHTFSKLFLFTSLLLEDGLVRGFAPTIASHRPLRTLLRDFANPDEVRKALEDKRAIIIDARRVDEIVDSGYLSTGRQWINVPCTPTDATLLEKAAEDMLGDDKTTPVLVYCASGKRAEKAKQVLEEKGYEKVLNLGGYKDLDYLAECE